MLISYHCFAIFLFFLFTNHEELYRDNTLFAASRLNGYNMLRIRIRHHITLLKVTLILISLFISDDMNVIDGDWRSFSLVPNKLFNCSLYEFA